MADSAELKIKEAARKILLKKGFDGARMQEIADEAGVNKAMLNYYFRSKKALFQVVFMEEFTRLFQNMVRILISPTSFENKISEFVETELNHLLEVPQLPLFIINELNKNPHLMAERLNLFPIEDVFNSVKSQYEKEVGEGKIRDIPFFQFLMNLQSLCIFPIIAKPIFLHISKANEEEYQQLIEERKTIVTDLITNYMIIKN